MTTAVEWLVEQIIKENGLLHLDLEAAKQMEKQQIVSAFNKGFVTDQWDKSKENKAKQYYNEKFNKK